MKCVVETRAEWKGNSEHPYKKLYGLVGIPAVLIMQKGTQLLKSDDEEGLSTEDILEDFLTAYQ